MNSVMQLYTLLAATWQLLARERLFYHTYSTPRSRCDTWMEENSVKLLIWKKKKINLRRTTHGRITISKRAAIRGLDNNSSSDTCAFTMNFSLYDAIQRRKKKRFLRYFFLLRLKRSRYCRYCEMINITIGTNSSDHGLWYTTLNVSRVFDISYRRQVEDTKRTIVELKNTCRFSIWIGKK